GVAVGREGNKDLSLLVVQFKGRAEPHLPQLGLLLRIPFLDTVSKVQGSNGLRTHAHIHVHKSLEGCKKCMSCLALLAAETSQDSLTRPNVLRWWHLIRYRGEHRELIQMVPEKTSELPEVLR